MAARCRDTCSVDELRLMASRYVSNPTLSGDRETVGFRKQAMTSPDGRPAFFPERRFMPAIPRAPYKLSLNVFHAPFSIKSPTSTTPVSGAGKGSPRTQRYLGSSQPGTGL